MIWLFNVYHSYLRQLCWKILTNGESYVDLLWLVQSMIGGIMKDTKSSVEQTTAIDSAVKLEKLFSSRPFTIPSTNSRSKSSAESSSSHLEIGTMALILVASNCFLSIRYYQNGGLSKWFCDLRLGVAVAYIVYVLYWPTHMPMQMILTLMKECQVHRGRAWRENKNLCQDWSASLKVKYQPLASTFQTCNLTKPSLLP